MIDRENARSILEEEGSLVMDGREDALIGIGSRCGQPVLAVYDRDLLVQSFMGDGMSHEEAEEWVCYNIEGGWNGDKTPLILERIEPESLDTMELQKDLEAVGLKPIVIDEKTDFNGPEFKRLEGQLGMKIE